MKMNACLISCSIGASCVTDASGTHGCIIGE